MAASRLAAAGAGKMNKPLPYWCSPQMRGSPLHPCSVGARQAQFAPTKDFRQPSLDIDKTPVWPRRHVAEDQAVSNQPVLLVEIRQGTCKVSQFLPPGSAGSLIKRASSGAGLEFAVTRPPQEPLARQLAFAEGGQQAAFQLCRLRCRHHAHRPRPGRPTSIRATTQAGRPERT